MKSLMKAGVVFLLPAVLLAGCGGGKKVAATVNGETITQDEFYDKALNVGLPDLYAPYQMGSPMKSGEFAMQSLVFEKLLGQYAKEKNAMPSEADVNNYIPFAKKYQQQPTITLLPPDPTRTEAAWRHDARLALIRRNLAMAPLKITEDDIKKEYEAVKTKITPADQFHLRLIDVKAQDKATKALDTLGKGVAFETVALTQSDDPMSKPKGGDIGMIPSTGLPPALLEAVKNLKPNEYTKSPVVVKLPSGKNGAQETHYFIAQFVEKKAGATPSIDEARPIAIWDLVRQKDPNAFQRVQEDVMKYKDKAKIEIAMKPYEHLLDKKPTPTPGTTPTGAPPAGAAPVPGSTGG